LVCVCPFLCWAGRSVWYDRSVGIAEAAGSNPAPSTTSEHRLFEVVWKLKTLGYSERTLKGYSKRLRMLSRNTNINNPESVKNYIACQSWSNAYKEGVVNAYVHYVRHYGLSWIKPVYKRPERLPNVPTTEQINKIISHAGRKYALVFSILRDTGLRPVELSRLTLENLDLEKGLIYPETAKGGKGRVLQIHPSTLAMLKEYMEKAKNPLFPSTDIVSHVFMRIRNRLSQRLHEPELRSIRLYDLRHCFATMLYHKTKDILHVMNQLGHRRLENTLIYTHLVNFRSDHYTSAVAKDINEAQKLVEPGFEYVTTFDSLVLFRKRK